MANYRIKLVLKGRLANSVETRNIFQWSREGDDVIDDDFNNINTKMDNILDDIVPHINTAMSFYAYEFWYSVGGDDWVFKREDTVTYDGEEIEDFASYQTAVLWVLKTGVKRAIGKKFFPGIDELATGDGLLLAGTLVDFALALTHFLTPVSFGFPQRTWYPSLECKASIAQPINAGSVGSILSTMRRRKPGYGI